MSQRHVKFAITAKRLIEKNGRVLRFHRRSDVPNDPLKPWRGTTEVAIEQFDAVAVVLDYEEDEVDGEIIRRGDRRVLLAVNSTPEPRPSLTGFHTVTDGTVVYSIVDVKLLNPGEIDILYDMRVRT